MNSHFFCFQGAIQTSSQSRDDRDGKRKTFSMKNPRSMGTGQSSLCTHSQRQGIIFSDKGSRRQLLILTLETSATRKRPEEHQSKRLRPSNNHSITQRRPNRDDRSVPGIFFIHKEPPPQVLAGH